MISAILVGLGLIAAAVGSFASEIYLAKKISTQVPPKPIGSISPSTR